MSFGFILLQYLQNGHSSNCFVCIFESDGKGTKYSIDFELSSKRIVLTPKTVSWHFDVSSIRTNKLPVKTAPVQKAPLSIKTALNGIPEVFPFHQFYKKVKTAPYMRVSLYGCES